MPYLCEECWAGKTIEVCKYYSARYGKRGTRRENSKPSTDAVRKINERQAQKKLRRLMNENFRDKVDALVTLDFAPDRKPESYGEMKRRTQNFLQRLRRKYKRNGIPCRYIWVAEIGEKGGVHIHMMLNDVDSIGTAGLSELWGEGATHVDALWSGGQYGEIAKYFCKYARKTEMATGVKLGRAWNPSHGLRQPRIRKRVIYRNAFRTKVKPKKGYHLQKDKNGTVVRTGVSEITGQEYMFYTMIRD